MHAQAPLEASGSSCCHNVAEEGVVLGKAGATVPIKCYVCKYLSIYLPGLGYICMQRSPLAFLYTNVS